MGCANMKKAVWIIGGVALLSLGSGPSYMAEVGYYEGRETKWHIGRPTTREECTREAIGMFNRMNEEDSGRAFSWACLYGYGGNIAGRVR